jgi:hypothetical protein
VVEVVPSLDVTGADLLVIPSTVVVPHNDPEKLGAAPQVIRALTARVRHLLTRGGHVCIAVSSLEMHPFGLGPSLLPWGVTLTPDTASEDPGSTIAEMDDLLNTYGVPHWQLPSGVPLPDQVRAVAMGRVTPAKTKGFVDASAKGLLYFLPVSPLAGDEARFVVSLANAIAAHAPQVLEPEVAPIADDFRFSRETELVGQVAHLEAQLREAGALVLAYRRRKSILYLRDDSLADALPSWLSENLGLPARRDEQHIEDLWLRDLADQIDIAISEVKAVSQNVKRSHVSALIHHREERDKEDDFPSVLIVNGFADAATVKEKDKERVSPKVVKLAVKNNILIVRTLDLMRLAELRETGSLDTQSILGLLTSNRGWLNVDATGKIEVIQD